VDQNAAQELADAVEDLNALVAHLEKRMQRSQGLDSREAAQYLAAAATCAEAFRLAVRTVVTGRH